VRRQKYAIELDGMPWIVWMSLFVEKRGIEFGVVIVDVLRLTCRLFLILTLPSDDLPCGETVAK
jgi:hypothetical protein